MNLGQAVAVCLYELVRGQEAAVQRSRQKRKPPATSGEVERLTQFLFEVLAASGYVKPRAVAAEENLRRMVRRMKLNANDAVVLLGMLRQMAWKLGTTENDR